jgi:arabinofuranan 3-O-arabinosyltransferase
MAQGAAVQRLSPEDETPLFPTRFGSDLLREFNEGSRWAKGLWVAALLIGILDALRWHSGAGFAYDSQPAWQSAHAILHGGASWNRFVYLPGCLLIVFPLALLPFKVTEALVYAVQILGLGYAFWAMTRVIKVPLGSVRIAWAALLFVLCGQLGIAAHYENFSILLLPLAAAFFLSIDSDRPMAAAVILGISLTVKPLLAPLLLPLLLARRWRETAVAVLIPAALSALTLLIVVGVNADPSKFWNEVTGTFSADTGKPWNISLTAMAGYLHAPAGVGTVAVVIVLAASLIACWRLWANPRGDAGEQAVWLTAPLFVIVILCTSFSWGYYCLLLVPLGFVSLRQDRIADWAVRLGVFLALAPPLLVYSLPGYPDRYYQEGADRIFGLGILLNGVSVIGVLIALGGCLMFAFADELPSRLQADFRPGRPELRSPPDRVSPALRGELLRE